VVARLLHAPPLLAARGFTRCRENKPGNRGVVTASSPLPFPAGGEEICHLQQKENAQTAMGFNRFLPLDRTILCLLSSSRFVSLCWWQIRPLARGPDLLCRTCAASRRSSTSLMCVYLENMERQGILVFLSVEKIEWESPPSILVTRNPNWS